MLTAVGEDGVVRALTFLDPQCDDEDLTRRLARLEARREAVAWSASDCRAVREQVREYLLGRRAGFDWVLDPRGTPFQRAVWRELRRVPYGATVSYKELAARVGRPRAVRAVGRANGSNPISLAIPCHRVLGSDGSLTGYAGGLAVKRALLELESRAVHG